MARDVDPAKLTILRQDLAEMGHSLKAMGEAFGRASELARNAGVEMRLRREHGVLPTWPPRADPLET